MESCQECKFWRRSKEKYEKDNGYCHRYPPFPRAVSESGYGIDRFFPKTEALTWCGEFRSR
jgi:hypothetical protein